MRFRSIAQRLHKLSKEPPLRLCARLAIERLPVSVRMKALWDAVERPQYLSGLLCGAEEARREGVGSISAIEFGVSNGHGLLLLERYAAMVEQESGISISVYGFDSGAGLPPSTDYRDHSDWWVAGDYPMDEDGLRKRLGARTTLLIGDVAATVPRFVRETQQHPLGFVACDLDLYTSTRSALRIFTEPGRQMLRRVPIYFDDVNWDLAHRFAGELLAIDEFNEESETVKIDRWRNVRDFRPFPESPWLRQMYQAHDLDTASRASAGRQHTWDPLPL